MSKSKELVTDPAIINNLIFEYNKYVKSWNEFEHQENENHSKTGHFNGEFKYSGTIGVMTADKGKPIIIIYFHNNLNCIYRIVTKKHDIWKNNRLLNVESFLKSPLKKEQVVKVWKEKISSTCDRKNI
jgi:hypothetical protein